MMVHHSHLVAKDFKSFRSGWKDFKSFQSFSNPFLIFFTGHDGAAFKFDCIFFFKSFKFGSEDFKNCLKL